MTSLEQLKSLLHALGLPFYLKEALSCGAEALYTRGEYSQIQSMLDSLQRILGSHLPTANILLQKIRETFDQESLVAKTATELLDFIDDDRR